MQEQRLEEFQEEKETKRSQSRKFKLTSAERAKIRYQLYRDNGYTAEEARKLRYSGYVDITGLRVDKTTGQVVKGRKYDTIKRTLDVDDSFKRLRNVENNTTFTQHAFLLNSTRHKGQYNRAIQTIKQRDNLSDDQAYYFAYFMMDSGYSYEFTRKELLSSREFEQYDKIKKARIEYTKIRNRQKKNKKRGKNK